MAPGWHIFVAMNYDAIIIGKGPAGIQAAVYLVRAGNSVLVIGKDRGALEKAEKVENYFGFPEAVSGAEIVDRGIAQAERLGARMVTDEVVGISYSGERYRITTAGSDYEAPAVLIATGKARSSLKVPGFEDLRGKGISFCAVCDGFFFRNKSVALVGSGEYAAREVHELQAFTRDITVFTNGEPVVAGRFPEGVRVVEERIARFAGTERLTGIETVSGATLPVSGCFVALGTAGASDFAAKIGVETRGNDIVVDGEQRTALPGLWAAGDCTGGYLQIAKAVADGAHAAKSMNAYLKALVNREAV